MENTRPFTSSQVTVQTKKRPEGGEVTTVTFKGRTHLNILGQQGMVELTEAMSNIAKNENCRLIILTGAGERGFMGGVDIQEMVSLNAESARPFITKLHQLCQVIRKAPMPVIAKIQGYCLGGGLEVAATCDIRIAADHSLFGMPEVKVGLPSVIEAALLPQLVGWGKTRELVLLGNTIDAQEAQACGLLERIAPQKELEQAVQAVVDHICEAGPQAIRLQKELIHRWEALPLEEAIAAGIDCFTRTFHTDEPQQMMQQFFDRQKARKNQ